MQEKSKGKKINYNLEALRGFAAIIVVLRHVILYNQFLDPHYRPHYLILFFPLAHFSVLVFFVLSGYVIGVSNKKRLNQGNVIAYVKKRAIRLYPIYIVSIFFGLIVANHSYSLKTIISNLLFAQGAASEIIWENNPICSLGYKVLYYLLFIPISFLI